jgi:hypothetical protein
LFVERYASGGGTQEVKMLVLSSLGNRRETFKPLVLRKKELLQKIRFVLLTHLLGNALLRSPFTALRKEFCLRLLVFRSRWKRGCCAPDGALVTFGLRKSG